MTDPTPAGNRLLLVDGDETFCRRLRALGEAEGWLVECAHSYPAASGAADENPPTIAVLDLATGDRALREGLCGSLRARDPSVGLILIAEQGTDLIVANALRLGFDDYLRKDAVDSEFLGSLADTRSAVALRRRESVEREAAEPAGVPGAATGVDAALEAVRVLSAGIARELASARADVAEVAIRLAEDATYHSSSARLLASQGKLSALELRLACLAPVKRMAAQLVSVPSAVQQSLEACSGLFPDRHVDVEHDIGAAVPRVRAVPSLVERLVSGMLVYALTQAVRRPRGIVAIEVRSDSEHVVIRVRDNGQGTTPGRAARLPHDPFPLPLDDPTPLVLPFCRLVAESLGGRLEVESELGRGTTITARLPFEDTTPRDHVPSRRTRDRRG